MEHSVLEAQLRGKWYILVLANSFKYI